MQGEVVGVGGTGALRRSRASRTSPADHTPLRVCSQQTLAASFGQKSGSRSSSPPSASAYARWLSGHEHPPQRDDGIHDQHQLSE